jgi:single-strand DNA-binding protein
MMFNEAQVSLTGYVATQPRFRTTARGTSMVWMRVAWTPRRLDRETGEWADGNTSYVTVLCWRKLADNVAMCIRKGDPVVVKGRLSVRTYDGKDGVERTAVEVDAGSVGHDLSRGVANFQRTRRAPGETAADQLAGGFTAGGLPGDEDLRRPGGMAERDPGRFGGEPAVVGAEGGPAGYDGADRSDGVGSSDGADRSDGADGQAGDDMFDEEAIAALAEGPGPVSVPF